MRILSNWDFLLERWIIMKFVETDGSNETEFFKMYPEYVNILREYDAEISATTMSEMKTRLRLPNSKVYLLQYHDDTVGFIILGTGFENSFSGHDIFIIISKEYPHFSKASGG